MIIKIEEFLEQSSYFNSNKELEDIINQIISKEEKEREALLIYSKDSYNTLFFKNEIKKKDGNKIFFDFSEKSYFSSYPAYYVVKEIYKALEGLPVFYKNKFPYLSLNQREVDVECLYDSLLGGLKRDLYSLELEEPLYIFIENIDLPYDNDFSLTFYRHFLFDKRDLPKNLYVFLFTGNKPQVEILSEYLRVVEVKDSTMNPKFIFKEILDMAKVYIKDEVLLLASPSLKLKDYLYIIDYILNYSNPLRYNNILINLLSKYNTEDLLIYILKRFLDSLSPKGRAIFAEGLIDLYMFNFGLTKDEILFSSRYVLDQENKYLKDYIDISKEEQDRILFYLEFFTKEEDNRLFLRDKTIKDFIGSSTMVLTGIVTSSYEVRLFGSIDYIFKNSNEIEITRYKDTFCTNMEIYLRDIDISNKIAKRNLVKNSIFIPLLKRLSNTILDYSLALREYKEFDRNEINDKEAYMLSYIERATAIAESAMDYGVIDAILSSPYLLYFIASKSRRAVRRILKRYINICYDYQVKVLNSKADGYGVFVPLAGCLAHLFHEGEFDDFKCELILLSAEVMDENGCLFNSAFKDSLIKYNVCPITDFVLNHANDEALLEFNSLLALVKEESKDYSIFIDKISIYLGKYQEEEDIYTKIMYAYLAIKAYIYLGEERRVNPTISSKLEPIMESIIIYMEYCYYPEVYGAIYMYFGRIYPKDYLHRLELGIHFLKSQGYSKELKLFISAFNYFSTIKNRGEE